VRASAPTEAQRLLLRACVLPPEQALDAWRQWREGHQGALDDASARLLPLAQHRLGAAAQDAARLDAYRATWIANTGLLSRLASALLALQAAGLRTLVLKGAALSVLHYRDAGARVMTDCDVLVPEADTERAWNVLCAAGWKCGAPPAEWRKRGQHAGTLGHPEAPMILDLHRHAIHACQGPGEDDGFWARAVPLRVGDIASLALGPADQLLHVLAHGLRWSKRQPFHWIADAATIVRASGDGLSWDALYDEARRRRLLPVIATGLKLVDEVAPGIVPDGFASRLRATHVPVTDRVEHWFAVRPPDGPFGTLPNRWFAYARSCRAEAQRPGPIGFLRRLGEEWGSGPRGLSRTLLRKAASRTRSLFRYAR